MFGGHAHTPSKYKPVDGFTPETKYEPFYGEIEEKPAPPPFTPKLKAPEKDDLAGLVKEKTKIEDIIPKVIDYKPRNERDTDILAEIADKQAVPRKITITAMRPGNKLTDLAKNRIFENLQRQLRREIKMAYRLETFSELGNEHKAFALEWASKYITPSTEKNREVIQDEVMQRMCNLVEPRVRDIVRELVQLRVNLGLTAEDEKHCMQFGDEIDEESEVEEVPNVDDEDLSEEQAVEDEGSGDNEGEEFARQFLNVTR